MSDSSFPYLVQRAAAQRWADDRTGIDAVLEFDYMGAAEFEFGAKSVALKAMRAHKDELCIKSYLTLSSPDRHGEQTELAATFLGRPQEFDLALRWFRAELFPGQHPRHKEPTDLRWAYGQESEDYHPSAICRTTVWWALDQGVPWMWFKNPELAERTLQALRGKT